MRDRDSRRRRVKEDGWGDNGGTMEERWRKRVTYIAEELNGCFDESSEEESDEDEGAQKHPGRLQFILRQQDDHDDNEEQSQRANSNTIRKQPVNC